MSQDNVELVRTFTERLNSGDITGALDLCDLDVEFDWSRRLLDPAVLSGRDEARGFFAETLELFDEMQIEHVELIDLGDDVLDVSAGHFRGRTSGADVSAQAAILWTVRSGKIVRFRFYQTKEDALQDLAANEAQSAPRDRP